MPRSENRRQIEIPTELYQELRGQADREGVPMAEVLRRLVTDGRSMQESYGQLAGEIHELRREFAALAEVVYRLEGK